MTVEKPENVRLAIPSDEDAVYRLLLKLHEDNSIGYAYEEEAVRTYIKNGTERRGGFVAVIDAPDRPGEISASVGLHFGQFWYSSKHYMAETWLFVDPDYRRGTGYADDLMNWVRWLKDAFNASSPDHLEFFTSVSSRKRLAQKAKWWARRGELIGHIFLIK